MAAGRWALGRGGCGHLSGVSFHTAPSPGHSTPHQGERIAGTPLLLPQTFVENLLWAGPVQGARSVALNEAVGLPPGAYRGRRTCRKSTVPEPDRSWGGRGGEAAEPEGWDRKGSKGLTLERRLLEQGVLALMPKGEQSQL